HLTLHSFPTRRSSDLFAGQILGLVGKSSIGVNGANLRDFPRVFAFGVSRAGEEPSEFAPLDHHLAPTFLADLIRFDFLALEIARSEEHTSELQSRVDL